MNLYFPAMAVVTIALTGCQSSGVSISNGGSQVNVNRSITVPSGGSARLGFLYAINPDCTPVQPARTVRVGQPPQHGQLDIQATQGFPSFPASNPRSVCNTRRVAGTSVVYHPKPGYVGTDSFSFEAFTTNGGLIQTNITANIQ